MGETTNGKINSKTKPVYFNLDDEDELELYRQACKMNFSKWVKKQLTMNNRSRIRNDRNYVGEEKVDIDKKEMLEIQNKEIDSMMI